jgi:hypothetical protein
VEVPGFAPGSHPGIIYLSTSIHLFKHNSGFLSILDKLSIMAGSKNNPGIRQFQRKKYYQGKELKPCLYDGRATKNGKYMSGHVDGDIVRDADGKPMAYHDIPVTFSVDTAE